MSWYPNRSRRKLELSGLPGAVGSWLDGRKFVPYGTGIQIPRVQQVLLLVSAVGDIEQRAESDILLDAEAPVVNRWWLKFSLHRRYAGGTEAQRRRQQIVDGRVIRGSGSDERRRLYQLQNLIVVETVVENSEPGRTAVLPFPNTSHAKPIRGAV